MEAKMITFQDLADQANENGGFTYNPTADTMPETGFAVSIFKNLEVKLDHNQLSAFDIVNYMTRNMTTLKNTSACLGGWKNEGRWYLDISVVVGTKAEALTLAKENNQLAIFDLGRGESIAVE
jgi:hypothetical protein